MESLSVEPPKHRMRITDQIHLNPAYWHNENNDKQLWLKQTKL
jgi:hypothetical protein